MIRHYCDRCDTEMRNVDVRKSHVKITLPTRPQGVGLSTGSLARNLDLCERCARELKRFATEKLPKAAAA